MTIRSLTLAAALLLPALARAAPPPPPGPAGAEPPGQRAEQVKRARLERVLGLAEALDLDEAGALRLRQQLAKDDERRAPLQRQLQDSLRVLRAAARGEARAAGQVEAALQRLAGAREKLAQLDAELLAQVTQGATPARKARAALFLARPAGRAGDGGPPGAGPLRPPGPPGAAPPGYPPRPAAPYAPPGTPPPGSPPEFEPPEPPANPGVPGPGAYGPDAEDWFSDSP